MFSHYINRYGKKKQKKKEKTKKRSPLLLRISVNLYVNYGASGTSKFGSK